MSAGDDADPDGQRAARNLLWERWSRQGLFDKPIRGFEPGEVD